MVILVIKGEILLYIAHIREIDHTYQSVQEHLEGVAQLASHYGKSVNLSKTAELAGFLHDLGKFSNAFKSYLIDVVIHQKKIAPHIDHSTAGAKYLYERFGQSDNIFQTYLIELVGMAILSHHSGLQNFLSLDGSLSPYLKRVVEKELEEFDAIVCRFEEIPGNKERVERLVKEATEEIKEWFMKIESLSRERNDVQSPRVMLSYLQQLVLSLLIDADRTNTRQFEENEVEEKELPTVIFENAYSNLTAQLNQWNQGEVTELNRLRNEMSEQCDRLAEQPSQIWTLSIPTGGGKTLASLRYALKHAIHFQKKRIIYIVPYTTILEQNAAAVRRYFDNPVHVLEHHATVVDDRLLDETPDFYRDTVEKKLHLGRDNWDHPVIFTTMVQFLNVFFAKGTRKTRRMHHLSNSVIIFDEVQSVPFQHQDLFNTAIQFLNDYCQSSILLCTATQPTVGKMKYPVHLPSQSEMVPQLSKIVKAFERVAFENHVDLIGWEDERLVLFIQDLTLQHQSILIVLNIKKSVLSLFEQLKQLTDYQVYHLSTSMCPAHRSTILKEMIGRLKEGLPTICVSTQLIEAGVDISFEAVVRSLAGLDSIAQAAGRCNRNAEREKGKVYLVHLKNESLSKLPTIRIGSEVTLDHVLSHDDAIGQLLSPEMIAHYFAFFYSKANREIDKKPKSLHKELIDYLNTPELYLKNRGTQMLTMYQTVEQHFKAIDSPTTAILVPYNDEAKEIIVALNEQISLKELNQLIKKAQPFIVNVFDYTLQKLVKEGLTQTLLNNSIFVLLEDGYHEHFGVSVQGEGNKTIHLY